MTTSSLPCGRSRATWSTASRSRFAGQSAPDGSAWEPLADSTIRDRLRRGYSAGPILERSGDLASRILADWDDEVAVAGTNLIYAATHHYGDDTRGIPARPFLGVSDEARQAIIRTLLDHLGEPLDAV